MLAGKPSFAFGAEIVRLTRCGAVSSMSGWRVRRRSVRRSMLAFLQHLLDRFRHRTQGVSTMAIAPRSRLSDARCSGLALVSLFVCTVGSGHDGPMPQLDPYGSWASPLSAEALSDARVNLGDLRSARGRLYWTPTVPAAGGISALFSMDGDAAAMPVTPDGINV